MTRRWARLPMFVMNSANKPEPTAMQVCGTCGSITPDPELHDKWHVEMEEK